MSEEQLPCTEKQPLYLDFTAMSYAFSVADKANEFLTAVLNEQPIAKLARELSVDLYELGMNLVGGFHDGILADYAQALLEVHFTHGSFVFDGCRSSLRIWKDGTEDSE